MHGTLEPHRDDLIGLIDIVAGVLLGLAVYLRVAGPVGGGIDAGARGRSWASVVTSCRPRWSAAAWHC